MKLKQKHRKLITFLTGLIFLIILIILVLILDSKNNQPVPSPTEKGAPSEQNNHLAYTPQISRNAADIGVDDRGDIFSPAERDLIAKNAGILNGTQFHANWDLQAQFDDFNNNIIPAAKAFGNNIKIFPYYNSTYWNSTHNMPNSRNDGWGVYATNFNSAWYLKDIDGNFLTRKVDPNRYVIDLSNKDYQTYAINTATDWIKKNPALAGVKFDSADLLDGNYIDRRIDGKDKDGNNRTWNQILCGQASTDCPAVLAWNNGLLNILSSVKKVLNEEGKEVYANGVSPSDIHGEDRNLGILPAVDGVMNEAFCYNVNDEGLKTNKPLLTPSGVKPVGDINLMLQLAGQGKKIFEITSSRENKEALAMAPYCLAGFLMGWQPGFSVWSYQTNYDDPLLNGWPELAEQNLNLGDPSASYIQKENLLTRDFENGFVMLNMDSKSTLSLNAPEALYQYKDGKRIAEVAEGDTISIPPMSGYFFLKQSFQPEE